MTWGTEVTDTEIEDKGPEVLGTFGWWQTHYESFLSTSVTRRMGWPEGERE